MSDNLSSFLGSAEGIPKRVMPIFFLIDTSGSMEGKKIGAVNSAMEEILPDLRHLSDSQADSEIRLSVMKFSSGCEWVTPALMSLDSFDDWVPLEAGGLTDLGAAFQELNSKMSKNGYMDRSSASSGFYAPLIILLSDGEPTDDWITSLKTIQQNKWYQSAMKIAIAIGEDANRDVLKKCIRNVELLFSVNDIGSLKKVIKFIAVTSSQIASTSAAVSTDGGKTEKANVSDIAPRTAEHQIAESVRQMLEEDNVGFSSSYVTAPVPQVVQSNKTNDDDDDDDWD